MVKVSVIIPVYNVEDYLNECLDSIINQTFEDIEIICVNDGSSDKSLNILKTYIKKDNRISIISQENKGAGAARNNGLKHANGDYIYFMDSDDKLKLNALEEIYQVAEEKSLDFLMFQLINYNEETGELYQDSHYNISDLDDSFVGTVFNYKDVGDLIFKIPASPVNKLYNFKFLKRINASFPENVIFEDNIFFWQVFLNASRISLIRKHYYIRRRHPSSITSFANMNYMDTLKIHNMTIELFKEHNIFEHFGSELFNKKLYFADLRFNQVNNKVKKVFFNEMKEDFSNMIEEYGFDEMLNCLNYKNKIFFKNVIDSKSSDEFVLLMKNYSLRQSIKKAQSENKKLKKDIKFIKKENKLILSSKSWKITKPLRVFSKIFR